MTTIHDAYRLGFLAAADWAKRSDLCADVDSPGYIKERDGLLSVKKPNYIVTINSRTEYTANTEDEVWVIIGSRPFGSSHIVRSPTGLDCDDFVAF